MFGNSLISLLLIAGICVVIGCVFGWLAASMRGGAEHEAAVTSAPVGPPVPQPGPLPGVTSPPTLLRLMRDADVGGLNMEVGGKVARSAGELSAEQRTQVVDLMKETATWLGLLTAASAPVKASTMSFPNSQDGLSEASLPAAAAPGGALKPSIISSVTNVFVNALGTPVPVKDAPKSMVQQIDEILQARLAESALQSQKIFLLEDPRKGVMVNIGSDTFEGIGAVPEGAVKNMLKSSVEEWERQQEKLRRR